MTVSNLVQNTCVYLSLCTCIICSTSKRPSDLTEAHKITQGTFAPQIAQDTQEIWFHFYEFQCVYMSVYVYS